MTPKITKLAILVATLSGLLLILFHSAHGTSCLTKFGNFWDFQKAHLSCMRTLGIMPYAVIQSSEDLARNDYNDKCLSNCILGQVNLLNANKTVNTVALKELITKNAPSSSHEKLFEIVSKCSNSTDIKSKELDANEKTKNVCKYAALFQYCFIVEDAAANVC